MRPLNSVLFALGLCVAVAGVQACATEAPGAELNPQPLPPEDKKEGSAQNERNPDEFGDTTGAGGGSTSSGSSSGGSSGTVPGNAPDGGDAGTDSGGDN